MDHYLSTHMQIINKHWTPFGMKSWTVAEFKPEDSLDGNPPKYVVTATIYWDRIEDLKEALAKGSKESGEDIKNYTDVHPEIWVGRVIEQHPR